MNVLEYAKGVERLVDPMAVGTSHYMQTRLRKLPVWLQRKIVTSATKKADKMPFVSEQGAEIYAGWFCAGKSCSV